MNFFKLISVLQGIAVAVLCVAVFQLSDQVEQLSSNSNNFTTSDVSSTSSKPPIFSQDDLRAVIREELQSNLVSEAQQIDQIDVPNDVDSIAIEPSKPEAIRAVDESIEYHISMGSISEGDMGNLESDIAKLDPASRTAMFSKLVRAMNDGRLNGRL